MFIKQLPSVLHTCDHLYHVKSELKVFFWNHSQTVVFFAVSQKKHTTKTAGWLNAKESPKMPGRFGISGGDGRFVTEGAVR